MYLLDTNIYFNCLAEPENVPPKIQTLLQETSGRVYVSAVVPWEIAIKYAKGKLPKGGNLLANYDVHVAKLNLIELAITGRHGAHAGQLPPIHQDPFDRLIIAQAQLEALTILTLDSVFEAYGVSVINT